MRAELVQRKRVFWVYIYELFFIEILHLRVKRHRLDKALTLERIVWSDLFTRFIVLTHNKRQAVGLLSAWPALCCGHCIRQTNVVYLMYYYYYRPMESCLVQLRQSSPQKCSAPWTLYGLSECYHFISLPTVSDVYLRLLRTFFRQLCTLINKTSRYVISMSREKIQRNVELGLAIFYYYKLNVIWLRSIV